MQAGEYYYNSVYNRYARVHSHCDVASVWNSTGLADSVFNRKCEWYDLTIHAFLYTWHCIRIQKNFTYKLTIMITRTVCKPDIVCLPHHLDTQRKFSSRQRTVSYIAYELHFSLHKRCHHITGIYGKQHLV